jgi:hypothetical protein
MLTIAAIVSGCFLACLIYLVGFFDGAKANELSEREMRN